MSMLKKSSFLLCLIIIMIGNVWFLNLKNDNSSLVGAYIDGEYASNIPSKDAGYVVEKIVCDNEAVGEWNYDDWGLLVKNMSKKSKCNIYFKKGIKLADTITLVDTSGKCPTVNDDGSVNVTSAESENSLLCSAPDNYGNSYYFRGNVQNNYVYFANFYWRIIRINGDGSIRMIYDGTTAHVNGEANEDRIIGTSPFNEKHNDNAYVGYMYGTPGASTYKETHANINDSTIKKYVDSWYENNLKNEVNEKYMSDNTFCNDRQILKYKPDNYTNLGYGTEATSYPWLFNKTIVTIKCAQKNDAFTSRNSTMGNGDLKYSIGILSVDEVSLSGGYLSSNKQYYLYTGTYIWTMTPMDFDSGGNANARRISDVGAINGSYDDVYFAHGVKPVINLKAGSLTIGDGSITNPYKIS